MTLHLKPDHLRRYKDVAWLFWKHGRADWVKDAGLDKELDMSEVASKGDGTGPDALTKDLESLGPAFIKIGQLLSSRADLLPQAYLKALSRLTDNVEPVPFQEIDKVIAEELDGRPSAIFSEIDPQPLGTASLAQVHAAKLRDGREVVIKVQRPGLEEELARDFEAFAAMAALSAKTEFGRKYYVEALVAELHKTIRDELDYRLEAQNLIVLARNLEEFPMLAVPVPYPQFSSRRVLTMERVSGASVLSINPVVFTEVDGRALGEELFKAYLKQVLIDGFFHADPHPGNIFLTRERKLGIVDLGMVGRIDEELQSNLLKLLIAVSEGRGREAAESAIMIGKPTEEFNRSEFLRRTAEVVMRNKEAAVSEINAGQLVMLIQQIAFDTGIRLPRSLTLVGKALMNLDGIARRLAPDMNPNDTIRSYSVELVTRRSKRDLSPGNIMRTALETADIMSQLPRRVNELLSSISEQGFRLKADVIDEKTLMEGFQKVANRITAGLILAAMLIGAAILTRVDTAFRLWGYPGIAIVMFMLAAAGGLILLYQIFVSDAKTRRK